MCSLKKKFIGKTRCFLGRYNRCACNIFNLVIEGYVQVQIIQVKCIH